jgi:hypothetical protein
VGAVGVGDQTRDVLRAPHGTRGAVRGFELDLLFGLTLELHFDCRAVVGGHTLAEVQAEEGLALGALRLARIGAEVTRPVERLEHALLKLLKGSLPALHAVLGSSRRAFHGLGPGLHERGHPGSRAVDAVETPLRFLALTLRLAQLVLQSLDLVRTQLGDGPHAPQHARAEGAHAVAANLHHHAGVVQEYPRSQQGHPRAARGNPHEDTTHHLGAVLEERDLHGGRLHGVALLPRVRHGVWVSHGRLMR